MLLLLRHLLLLLLSATSLFAVSSYLEKKVSLCLREFFSSFLSWHFVIENNTLLPITFGNYYYYKSNTFFYYYYSRIPKILLLLPHVCHSQSYNFSDRMTCKIFIVQSLLSLSLFRLNQFPKSRPFAVSKYLNPLPCAHRSSY